jgi:hypothetical protein
VTAKNIPSEIGQEERIIRTIFHPANFNEKKGTLKSNFMKPPANEIDEDDPTIMSNKLSVTRYDYAGINFCRSHAHAHQKEPRRHYWGFARFVVGTLEMARMINGQSKKCKVEYKPVDDNPAHANINMGFRLQPGEPLDSETNEYIKQLADSAEVLQDPDPASDSWKGTPIDDPKYGKLTYKGK